MKYLIVLVIVLVAIRIVRVVIKRRNNSQNVKGEDTRLKLPPKLIKLYTVWVFFVVNLKRVFRDRVALFFTFLFPLIFLFVFGSLSHSGSVSFRVALINDAHTTLASQYAAILKKDKTFNISASVTTLAEANQSMNRGEIDVIIQLPPGFGKNNRNGIPSGSAVISYSQSNAQEAEALKSIMQSQLALINSRFVKVDTPLKVVTKPTNQYSLTAFDYTFTGLLGFAVLGAGIFGPMNVFPELKKMGILRRLHTTPLRVWQFFLSNMLGQAVTGLLSLAVMIAVAIGIYNLKVVGDFITLTAFLILGIILILGIGLALGGWAKNERQVAPLGNIIVFPMMFLTGVFFPRYLMPQWLQTITNYMPLTPVIDGARMILTEGKSLLDLGPQLAVMGVWLVIVYAIAFRVFRWE
jgi:ABC-2 type transport system permease protein